MEKVGFMLLDNKNVTNLGYFRSQRRTRDIIMSPRDVQLKVLPGYVKSTFCIQDM